MSQVGEEEHELRLSIAETSRLLVVQREIISQLTVLGLPTTDATAACNTLQQTLAFLNTRLAAVARSSEPSAGQHPSTATRFGVPKQKRRKHR